MMQFHISERRMQQLTGYSRVQLRTFREGNTRTVRGKTYTAAPILKRGEHWERLDNGGVLYADLVVNLLLARRQGREAVAEA